MRRSALGLLLCAAALVACKKDDAPAAGSAAPSASASDRASAPGAIGSAGKKPREKFDAIEVDVPPQKSSLHVAWKLPDGTGVNDEAPFVVRWVSSDGLASAPADISAHGKDVEHGFDVPIELMRDSSGGKLVGDIDMVVCDVATHAVCVPLKRELDITLNAQAGVKPGAVSLPLPSAR